MHFKWDELKAPIFSAANIFLIYEKAWIQLRDTGDADAVCMHLHPITHLYFSTFSKCVIHLSCWNDPCTVWFPGHQAPEMSKNYWYFPGMGRSEKCLQCHTPVLLERPLYSLVPRPSGAWNVQKLLVFLRNGTINFLIFITKQKKSFKSFIFFSRSESTSTTDNWFPLKCHFIYYTFFI